jgi:predicted glycoside hydrolase/deacetylase ChbG (UPF0249 family)
MKKIAIINADDYGLTASVSNGICEAYLNGILTSTTVMVTGLTVEQDLPLLIKECPGIGIGVHLTLTTFKPISNPLLIPSLIGSDEKFHKLSNLINCAGELNEEELYIEWKAQIDLLISFGVKIDHLDSHHNACIVSEKTVNVMAKLAKEYALPVRTPMSPNNNLALEQYAKNELDKLQIIYPQTLNISFMDNKGAQRSLIKILNKLESGVTEIMSHPGFIDEDLRSITSLVEQRLTELNTLCSKKARNAIDENNIELSTFGNIFKNGERF